MKPTVLLLALFLLAAPATADPCDQFETTEMAVSLWSWDLRTPEKIPAMCIKSFADRVRVRNALNETGDYWKAYCSKETGFIRRQLNELKAHCVQYNPGKPGHQRVMAAQAAGKGLIDPQVQGTASHEGLPSIPSKYGSKDKANEPKVLGLPLMAMIFLIIFAAIILWAALAYKNSEKKEARAAEREAARAKGEPVLDQTQWEAAEAVLKKQHDELVEKVFKAAGTCIFLAFIFAFCF